jgi:hypothetical protein
MMRLPIGGIVAAVTLVGLSGCCLKMSDLQAGASYSVGEILTTSGTDILVERFQWGSGEWTESGAAVVDTRHYAQGSGLDLHARNVNLRFRLDYPLAGLDLAFGELGGNNNIEINGEFHNVADLVSLDGMSIGGVHVHVSATQDGNNWHGRVSLTGSVSDFSLGGQELWLDDVCPQK